MSDLAAGGSGPESDAGAVATAEAPGSRGGEPLGPGTGHTGVNVALWAGVPVVTVQGLDGGGDISSWIPTSMFELPVHRGGRQEGDFNQRSFPILLRETDQRVQLEDFEEETHIDLPWDQGELTVTFTPLASRRGSSTDFGP